MTNLQIDSPLKFICSILLFLIIGYLTIRLFAKALFTSYFEAFKSILGGKHGIKQDGRNKKEVVGENKKEL